MDCSGDIDHKHKRYVFTTTLKYRILFYDLIVVDIDSICRRYCVCT